MFAPPVRTLILTAAASLGLAGCVGNLGYGAGYGGYGDRHYSGYGDPYYGGYGYGYGSPYGYPSRYGYGYVPSYYGWYGDRYYPGSGYWVYDRDGHRHEMTEEQKRFWANRQSLANGTRKGDNWSDFIRRDTTTSGATTTSQTSATTTSAQTVERRQLRERRIARQQSAEQQPVRSEARARRLEEHRAKRAASKDD